MSHVLALADSTRRKKAPTTPRSPSRQGHVVDRNSRPRRCQPPTPARTARAVSNAPTTAPSIAKTACYQVKSASRSPAAPEGEAGSTCTA